MRLSAPTNKTFGIAAVLLLVGVVSYLGYAGDLLSEQLTYWSTAAGGILLVIGSVFNKL